MPCRRAHIDRITQAKLSEGVTNATVNRMLEVLRAVLRKCVTAWDWLDRVPHVRMLKEPVRRIRYLTREEAKALLAELPEHLADLAAVSLATGLRRANVTGLQWEQVDLGKRRAWIHPDQAKARRAIAVPLNEDAMAVVVRQVGKHPTHVFSFRGRPIQQVSTKAWYLALQRAGIETSAGMICGIPGRAGTCRTAHRSRCCRNWAAGRVWRWCGDTRT